MPRHDPIPPPRRQTDTERRARAWARYLRLMSWMGIAAVVAVLLALIYLKSAGRPVSIHMTIATIAGVGLTVLLGTGLMGLAYFSSHSGHDDSAGGGHDDQSR
jgi:hypothetical protein